MDKDIWAGLSVFAGIAESGSFAKAAIRLGVSPSALSHAMRNLETRLGIRLLDRTTRSVSPTAAGETLLASLQPALASVEQVLGVLDAGRNEPAGSIRINAHRPAAVYVVMPRLSRLAAIAPGVTVELVVNDGMVDIVAERFDCGIRHEGKLQQDMIALRISEPMPLIFVASAAYLASHGMPDGPDDLGNHRCVVYRHTSSGVVHRWEFEHEGQRIEKSVQGSFATNDVDLMRDAVVAGLGIGCLLRSQAEPFLKSGDLVEVLPGQAPPLPANYLYYPSRRQPTAAFRAFLEVMRE
ncbi:LysR family transcriptional regulator [Porphyrobacter sp. TH134]|uniref:LysR family transcriptional regulator n=1 Tax=Porphyrobacter sp. TH134 TaxID=2067450 RepID=UPI000C79F80F|nr:LysR family transcriptional regulator [Porphyrobacter sp. TH134]PLK23319.1 LysR family transcriptional regulator [Porphyrobacter sp. TH134]